MYVQYVLIHEAFEPQAQGTVLGFGLWGLMAADGRAGGGPLSTNQSLLFRAVSAQNRGIILGNSETYKE